MGDPGGGPGGLRDRLRSTTPVYPLVSGLVGGVLRRSLQPARGFAPEPVQADPKPAAEVLLCSSVNQMGM